MKNKINIRGNEPHFKQKIDEKKFKNIFGTSGQSSNYILWKKIATLLKIKWIPTQIDGIKCSIEHNIQNMDWDDINKIFNFYIIKHSKKKIPLNTVKRKFH